MASLLLISRAHPDRRSAIGRLGIAGDAARLVWPASPRRLAGGVFVYGVYEPPPSLVYDVYELARARSRIDPSGHELRHRRAADERRVL
jgi:hypothetical protein